MYCETFTPTDIQWNWISWCFLRWWGCRYSMFSSVSICEWNWALEFTCKSMFLSNRFWYASTLSWDSMRAGRWVERNPQKWLQRSFFHDNLLAFRIKSGLIFWTNWNVFDPFLFLPILMGRTRHCGLKKDWWRQELKYSVSGLFTTSNRQPPSTSTLPGYCSSSKFPGKTPLNSKSQAIAVQVTIQQQFIDFSLRCQSASVKLLDLI